jgi:outer membrane protein assembly factor BamD (BamD/ComL family)
MAKQRRPQSRSTKAQAGPSRPVRSIGGAGGIAGVGTGRTDEPLAPLSRSLPSAGPQRRTTSAEAVALYERGLEKLQQHDYSTAMGCFESVLNRYPEEKELHERVKLYLNICRRQVTSHESAPKTVEERLYASTLALNGGRYDEAISHLRLVRDEDADNDHALYMLAVAHAQRGELAEAVAHVERAIALNPENRALARHDPDLDPLRDDDSFRAALEAPSSRSDRRRPVRPRPAR